MEVQELDSLDSTTVDSVDTSNSGSMMSTPGESSHPIKTIDGKNGSKPLDSPAFRLRPRRSTPKTAPMTLSAHKRYSVFAKDGPILEKCSSYTTVESVKRKLFKILSKGSEDEEKKPRIRPPSPSSSIKSEVDLGIFSEKVELVNLNPDQNYSLNYICLRVIQVDDLVAKSEHGSDEQSRTIYAQEADGTSSQLLDESKPVIRVILYNVYATTPILSKGKVIELTKFQTAQSPMAQSMTISGCDTQIQSLPLHVVVKPTSDWVPIVSIKSQFHSINNPLMLKVDTTNKKSEQPSPGLRFTSYCTKLNSRRSVSVDDLCLSNKGQSSGRRSTARNNHQTSTCSPVGRTSPKCLRSSSKNVSPQSTASTSSSATIVSPSSSVSPPANGRMKAVDFSKSSASRVTKSCRRVSASP